LNMHTRSKLSLYECDRQRAQAEADRTLYQLNGRPGVFSAKLTSPMRGETLAAGEIA